MKLNRKQIRQGDVLLVRNDDAQSAEPERIDGNVILAHGEVTGHKHQFVFEDAEMMRGGGAVRVLKDGALLKHEEHGAPAVPAGIYDLPLQVEWTDSDEPIAVQD